MSFTKELKEASLDLWEASYYHSFVQEIGKGTLAKEKFKFYLLQDYLYLIEYAKVYAQGIVKADELEIMKKLAKIPDSILNNEMKIHRGYMKEFGIKESEIQNVKTALFNQAYSSNMLAIGANQDIVAIMTSLLPCNWTYLEYARRLKSDYKANLKDNFYLSWIEGYASKEFEESFNWFFPYLDEKARKMTKDQKENLITIFRQSIEFEYLFWDMSYKMEMSFNL